MGTKPRWLRFGVGTLLFLMACAAGYLTGFRWGVWEKQQGHPTKIVTQVYRVDDLIRDDEDWSLGYHDSLIDLIVSTVSSDIWIENGGAVGEIRAVPSTKSLVVTCDVGTHDEIADVMEELRNEVFQWDEKALMKAIRQVQSQRPTTPSIVQHFMLPLGLTQTVGHFESGLQLVTKWIGKPSEIHRSDSQEFPNWIGAQQIAVWDSEEGQLYFARMESGYEGDFIVVGWRSKGVTWVEPVRSTSDLDIPFRKGDFVDPRTAAAHKRRQHVRRAMAASATDTTAGSAERPSRHKPHQ